MKELSYSQNGPWHFFEQYPMGKGVSIRWIPFDIVSTKGLVDEAWRELAMHFGGRNEPVGLFICFFEENFLGPPPQNRGYIFFSP